METMERVLSREENIWSSTSQPYDFFSVFLERHILNVEHLDRDGTVIKTYIFKNAWPKTMSEVTLDSSEDSTIAEFECTWRYQHFEASGVNF